MDKLALVERLKTFLSEMVLNIDTDKYGDDIEGALDDLQEEIDSIDECLEE